MGSYPKTAVGQSRYLPFSSKCGFLLCMEVKETGSHSFEIEDAVRFGSVEKALIFKEISRMVVYKVRNKKPQWVYYSASALGQKFPYLNARSIERWLKELVDEKYLFSITKNKHKYDRTKSYTLPQFAEHYPQNEAPIPPEGEPIPPLSTPLSTPPSYFSEEKLEQNKLPKDRLGGNTHSRDSTKEEDTYTVVPVNDEGDEISPRKKVDRSYELGIEQRFITAAVKRGLPRPERVPPTYLSKISKSIKSLPESDLDVFFDWWFTNGLPDMILNFHSAFSTFSINRFRARGVIQSKKSDPKYDNIKTKKYEIS